MSDVKKHQWDALSLYAFMHIALLPHDEPIAELEGVPIKMAC